jgi:hypothetical protein
LKKGEREYVYVCSLFYVCKCCNYSLDLLFLLALRAPSPPLELYGSGGYSLVLFLFFW